MHKGDTLVVVRIDRFVHSLAHLLEMIERLQGKRCLLPLYRGSDRHRQPAKQVYAASAGSCAEFERALIRERTKAGLASARLESRIGGNSGSRARDPAALRTIRLARYDGYMERLPEVATECVPFGTRLCPEMAWEDLLRIVDAPLPEKPPLDTASSAQGRTSLRPQGFLPGIVLTRAARRLTDDRLLGILAAIKGADADITLQAICDHLETMLERTPRGRSK